MPKIVQLSSHVADLIAAGEVVERPASVVKELLENSIDAGAETVTVEIQNGGMTLLRVTDDGCGIAAEDAETAFLRHATSKIRKKEDLEAIGTLGFRGEALAATAAVSKIDLLTRTADAEEGTRLHLEAGRVLTNEPAGCPVGTTIIVRDLFYNTPARMKFMKQDSVEGAAVFSAVQKQALAHPEVSVRFIKDGAEQLHTPGDGDLLAAVYSVLGRQTAMDMTQVASGWERLKLTGYVSKPTATRGNRSQQIFFINHRYVRSKTLTAALEEAYRNQIMVGRFPSCVLNIEIPLSMVDVNVHPAKTEVKFLNEREVFDTVHYGVLAALNRTSGRVEMKLNSKTQSVGGGVPDTSAVQTGQKRSAPHTGVILSEAKDPLSPAAPKKDFYRTMDAKEYKTFISAVSASQKTEPSEGMKRAVFGTEKKLPEVHDTVYIPSSSAPAQKNNSELRAPNSELPSGVILSEAKDLPPTNEQTEITENNSELRTPNSELPSGVILSDAKDLPPANVQTEITENHSEFRTPNSEFTVVGEVLNTYIIAEQDETVLFIDKHAAHERILFEKLKAQPLKVMGQSLLLPRTCELDREDAAILLQNRELLLSLGYDMDDAGDGTLLLRQIPAELDEQSAEESLAELAEHLHQGKLDKPETVRDELLHSVACKAAIKAGWYTDAVSRAALVKEVLSRDDLKYCPHGRPICITLTKKQLEKQFKRIQ